MNKSAIKRATVYFEEDLHQALRLKALETQSSVSEIVNNAIRESLSEDEEDLDAFRKRAHEKSISFEVAIQDLKARGRI